MNPFDNQPDTALEMAPVIEPSINPFAAFSESKLHPFSSSVMPLATPQFIPLKEPVSTRSPTMLPPTSSCN